MLQKEAITNIHFRTILYIDPSITKDVFKGFLRRDHAICSEKCNKEETQFLTDMLLENGYKRAFLENLVKTSNAKKRH